MDEVIVRAAKMLAGSNPEAKAVLMAALLGCEVRGEEGLRTTWIASGRDAPDDHFDGDQPGWARQAVAFHLDGIANEPDWALRPTLIHRFIITTPAEEKTDGDG